MKKEDFTALGISEELAEKAAAASAEELKSMVPKTRLDEVIAERNTLRTEKENAERAKEGAENELDGLKKNGGDTAALLQEIERLKEAASTSEANHAAEIKKINLANAIRLAVTDAQDSDIVAGLLDKDKLTLGDDGTVTGLDEQIKMIREAKPFLFKPTDKGGRNGTGFRIGSIQEGVAGGVGGDKQLTMREAIAAKIQATTEK